MHSASNVLHSAANTAPSLWGGLECTIVRVGDDYRNQVQETGHGDRLDDLDAIAGLGLEALRYPVLWESISPESPSEASWDWHDVRLNRLKELGVEPIAGLVHHGSGPRYTNLLDKNFPELLAGHAAAVARRYPWLKKFTPINEPLTTARFSGLYGHWHPHGRDYPTFLRCLVNECRGVALAMRAIREFTPDAQLIQTEDLGRTFSTPNLVYQANHENERRWLGFDLLCGRVDRHHPWHRILLDNGIEEKELSAFVDEPCRPDVIGINHYLTSDRFLDHRCHLYPKHLVGGNGREAYVDTEAVRIEMESNLAGPEARLREAWERYGLPLAVTEIHNGCTREEQLRWLRDIWNAAGNLKRKGVDFRAVTLWSLLGAMDWNSLLTERNGHYETGVFDTRAKPMRPTALAYAAQSLAKSGSFDHPTLDGMGWWYRNDRYHHPPRKIETVRYLGSPRRIAITGRTGTLGHAFSRICSLRGLDHTLLGRDQMDIADPISVENALAKIRPWAVVNTAGFVRVADAEREQDRCWRENTNGAAVLATACARLGIPFVTFSSDLVFDGTLGRAYQEEDPVAPNSVYGASKAEAETLVRAAHPEALIVRTSAFFGPWDSHNILHHAFRTIDSGHRFCISDRASVSPTYVPDLVHATLDLLIDGEVGLRHLSNGMGLTWYAFVRLAAALADLDESLVVTPPEKDIPRSTILDTSKGIVMPSLPNALERFLRDGEISWRCTERQASAR